MKSKAIEHGGAELNSCKRADSTSSFVSIHVVYLRIYYKDCNSDCLRACVLVCVYLFSWTPEPSRPRSTGTNNHTHRRRIVKTGNTFEVYFNCYYRGVVNSKKSSYTLGFFRKNPKKSKKIQKIQNPKNP